MSFVWDSNMLRHYLADHPLLLENLTKIPRQHVVLPIVVAAEQLRGRADALLEAVPAQLARAQDLWRQTQALLGRFHLLYFDEQSLILVGQLQAQTRTRKRYLSHHSADFVLDRPALSNSWLSQHSSVDTTGRLERR